MQPSCTKMERTHAYHLDLWLYISESVGCDLQGFHVMIMGNQIDSFNIKKLLWFYQKRFWPNVAINSCEILLPLPFFNGIIFQLTSHFSKWTSWSSKPCSKLCLVLKIVTFRTSVTCWWLDVSRAQHCIFAILNFQQVKFCQNTLRDRISTNIYFDLLLFYQHSVMSILRSDAESLHFIHA